MLATLTLAAVLGSAAPGEVDVVWLRAEGVSSRRLADAIELRMPDLDVEVGSARPSSQRLVYIRVEPHPSGAFTVEIVTADGRGYARDVDPGEDPPERVIATTLATLLAAIEDNRVEPDRRDAEIPEAKQPPPADPPSPTPEPTRPEPRPLPPPRWELGVAVPGAVVLGLAPAGIGGPFAGAGGAAELHARRRDGLFLGGGVRATGRRGAGLGLLRTRFAGVVGYSYRQGRAELSGSVVASAEYWRVLDVGSAGLENEGNEPPPVLLGVSARVSPGLRVPVGRTAFRIGPRVELGGALVPDRGLRTAGIVVRDEDGSTRDAFRVGGLELEIGLEFALWWGVS